MIKTSKMLSQHQKELLQGIIDDKTIEVELCDRWVGIDIGAALSMIALSANSMRIKPCDRVKPGPHEWKVW